MTTSISSVTGTFGYDNTLTVNGSGFGTKTRSRPLSYCDFQNGTLQPNSAVSNNTTLASVQNVNFVNSAEKRWGNGGVGSAAWLRNSTANGNSATLQVQTGWGYTNRNLFVFAWRKWLNADTTGNWKTWRFWPGTDGSGGYPDCYLGAPAIEGPGGWVWSIEGVSFTEGVNHKWLAAGLQPTSTWRSEMLFMKHNSSTTAVDGSLAIYFDGLGGTQVTNDTDFSFSYAGATAVSSTVYLQDTKASSNPGGSMQSFYGDYYVDDSFNQVFMGNASTWAACTHIEVQPFTAWADGQITIKQRPGTFTTGTNTYVYVLDVNGNPNATGYNLSTLNPSPTPPTLVSLSPTSGPIAGLAGVVGTCTNLTATLNGVSVGGTAATSVVRNSATQFTATFPAKATGTYSVVVTNSDSTAGTLVNGWTAISAPVVISCALQASSFSPFFVSGSYKYNTAPIWPQVTVAGFGPKNVIINGTGFQSGCTVTFKAQPFGSPVAAGNVRFVSSTQLLADITDIMSGGPQLVTVTNPGGQTSGTSGNGAFTATTGTCIFAVSFLPSLGDVLYTSSHILALDDRLNTITSLVVGGTNVTATAGWEPMSNAAPYGMWVIGFKAPAHAAGNADVAMTINPHGSYTFTGGAVFYAPPTGSGATGLVP